MSKFQKSPSIKRYIKTTRAPYSRTSSHVRKHRAPNGALRLSVSLTLGLLSDLGLASTEHHKVHFDMEPLPRRVAIMTAQKAPSAIRCIKTCQTFPLFLLSVSARKHQATYGASRRSTPQAFVETSPLPNCPPHNRGLPATTLGGLVNDERERYLRARTSTPLRRVPPVLSLPPRHPGAVAVGGRGG